MWGGRFHPPSLLKGEGENRLGEEGLVDPSSLPSGLLASVCVRSCTFYLFTVCIIFTPFSHTDVILPARREARCSSASSSSLCESCFEEMEGTHAADAQSQTSQPLSDEVLVTPRNA